MRTILLLSFLFSLNISAKQNRVLSGVINSKEKCDSKVQIWVSKNKELIYQIEGRLGSSFEVHLVPNTYDLRVATKDGCHLTKSIDLVKSDIISLPLQLEKI